jgi:hypothetical protein
MVKTSGAGYVLPSSSAVSCPLLLDDVICPLIFS